MKHLDGLLRHFADLREGTHGGLRTRAEKERLFVDAVAYLDQQAHRALTELNDQLLGGRGRVDVSGVIRDPGPAALWTLRWPEQHELGSAPVTIRAHYGLGFHHPHLRGGTVGEWPLNVFDAEQAAAELPTLRAIAAADLHNLVFAHGLGLVPSPRP